MDDYRKYHIPAFGSWDVNNDLPITQYFESARQAGLVRCNDFGFEDLYKVHDIQQRVEPNMTSHPKAKGRSKKQRKVRDMTAPPRRKPRPPAPRAVDEDLYKIPPELLRPKSKRGKVMGMLTGCLGPGCAA